MQKRERRLTALLLGCLALVSAAVTAWVCLKEQPEKIVAFETRFLNVSEMGFEAAEGLAVEALPDALTLRWRGAERRLRRHAAGARRARSHADGLCLRRAEWAGKGALGLSSMAGMDVPVTGGRACA